MPWLTVNTHVTDEDAILYEEMLDQIAEADRLSRLRSAYAVSTLSDVEPVAPSNLSRLAYDATAEGWEIAGHCPTAREAHHD